MQRLFTTAALAGLALSCADGPAPSFEETVGESPVVELPFDEGDEAPGAAEFDEDEVRLGLPTWSIDQLERAQPGDVVQVGDYSVLVPPPGRGVTLIAERHDGTHQSIHLVTRQDGRVVQVEETHHEGTQLPSVTPSLPDGALGAPTTPAACADGAYALSGFSWKKPLAWWFKAAATPRTLNAGKVEGSLRRGAAALTSLHNNCGRTDRMSGTHVYKGRTTRGTNFVWTGTVGCGNPDDFNVVSFGFLDGATLALTCSWWWEGGEAAEMDMRFDKDVRWSTSSSVPLACQRSFMMDSVGTHEFGHAFGLDHVRGDSHAALTMTPYSKPCSLGPKTLGLGDIRGLKTLYP